MRVLVFLLLILIATTVYGYRILKPQTFTLPWTDSQMGQLNETLESLWLIQNGRFESDIVTTAKTNARNGEIWMIQTGAEVRIQFRANNTVFTLTPDGF